jgi:hypothetical protein
VGSITWCPSLPVTRGLSADHLNLWWHFTELVRIYSALSYSDRTIKYLIIAASSATTFCTFTFPFMCYYGALSSFVWLCCWLSILPQFFPACLAHHLRSNSTLCSDLLVSYINFHAFTTHHRIHSKLFHWQHLLVFTMFRKLFKKSESKKVCPYFHSNCALFFVCWHRFFPSGSCKQWQSRRTFETKAS